METIHIKNYLIAAAWAGMSDLKPTYYNQVVEDYLNKLGEKGWLTKPNWEFIQQYSVNIYSKSFAYILAHPQKFAKLGTPGRLKQYIEKVIGVSTYQVVRSKEKNKLNTYKTHLRKIFGEKAEPYVAEVTYKYYLQRGNASFAQTQHYLDKYCNDEYELATGAKNIAKQYQNKEKLEAALGWVNKSIKLKASVENTEIKGRLLFKLQRYKEAKSTIEQALQLAMKEKVDDRSLMGFLIEIDEKL